MGSRVCKKERRRSRFSTGLVPKVEKEGVSENEKEDLHDQVAVVPAQQGKGD